MSNGQTWNNPISVDGTSLYIDKSLFNQAVNLSASSSYGNNFIGFKTPSSPFLNYTINDDGSLTYYEQDKAVTVSCSDVFSNLNKLILPYTYTNYLGDAPINWTADAQHTTSFLSGFWIQFDLTSFQSIKYTSFTVNVPDVSIAPTAIVVFGSSDAGSTWNFVGSYGSVNSPLVFTSIQPTSSASSRTFQLIPGNGTYPYVRLVFPGQGFAISSIQILNDSILAGTEFGKHATSTVAFGSTLADTTVNFNTQCLFNGPGPVKVSNIQPIGTSLVLGGSVTLDGGVNLNSKLNFDDTYPPTATSLKAPTANVVAGVYSSIPPVLDVFPPVSTSASAVPSANSLTSVYNSSVKASAVDNTYPPQNSVNLIPTSAAVRQVYNLANTAVQVSSLSNVYPPTSTASNIAPCVNVVRQLYSAIPTLDNTYPPTSSSTTTAATTNVVRQVYNAMPIATPTFYFRYSGSFTCSASGVQLVGITGLTLQQNNLNGLSIGSIVNTTAKTLTFPYTGMYAINFTLATNTGIGTTSLTSSSGTYGTATIGSWGYNGSTSNPTFNFTTYFAANDVVQISHIAYTGTGGSSVTVPSFSVALLTRLA
jgi:hypothetical protein